MKELWSRTEIAKECGVSRESVLHVIKTRKIDYTEMQFGGFLYNAEACQKISDALNAIARKRRARGWRVRDQSVLASRGAM